MDYIREMFKDFQKGISFKEIQTGFEAILYLEGSKDDFRRYLKERVGKDIADYEILDKALEFNIVADYDFLIDFLEEDIIDWPMEKVVELYEKGNYEEYLERYETIDTIYCDSYLSDVVNELEKFTTEQMADYIPEEYSEMYEGGIDLHLSTNICEGYWCSFNNGCYLLSSWDPDGEKFHFNYIYNPEETDYHEMQAEDYFDRYYTAQTMYDVLKKAL